MINQKNIADGLRSLGLKEGDIVLLHSSLLSLGQVEGGPAAVIDAFLNVLTEKGTLLVPVFGALGILTDEVKNRPNAVISPCPAGTLAAIGKDAEELCCDHWKADTVHGQNTPYTRIAERNGYICLLGVDQDRNTTLHSVEALLELPYLGNVTRTFATPEGETVTKTWKYYPGPHRDFIGLDPLLEAATVQGRIGSAQVRLIRAKELYEIALAVGKNDPAFVLCDNPACADCVRQRAAIFRTRIEREETFRLSASARLAGRYVPEIIENLQNAGIQYVELDYIQGKAWRTWGREKLAAWIAEFNDAGIAISAARCFSVPDDVQGLVDLAVGVGIGRLLLPLNDSRMAANAAANAGLEVAYFNTSQPAIHAAAKLERHRATAAEQFGLVFNPAGFVLAGEMPFLQSFKLGRFVKTLAQLDVLDQTWDGAPKKLAMGNSEIKELISILRCRNFNGFMALGGGGTYPGTLREAVEDFTYLLDNM